MQRLPMAHLAIDHDTNEVKEIPYKMSAFALEGEERVLKKQML